jgi:tellurite resistance protein TerC
VCADDDDDLKDNAVMKIARRLVNAQDEYDGEKFFSRSTGVRRATPMLVVLVCIELSDVIVRKPDSNPRPLLALLEP